MDTYMIKKGGVAHREFYGCYDLETANRILDKVGDGWEKVICDVLVRELPPVKMELERKKKQTVRLMIVKLVNGQPMFKTSKGDYVLDSTDPDIVYEELTRAEEKERRRLNRL